MKKILCILCSLLMLTGCSMDVSYMEFMDDYLENTDTYTSIEDILGYIEFDDAQIGLSIAKTKEGSEALLLDQRYRDEKGFLSSSTHEHHVSLTYKESDGKRIWYEALISGDVFHYSEDKTTDYKYVCGILDGTISKISYQVKELKQKSFTFDYLSKKVEVTLWVLRLPKEETFDIQTLSYS
ncbi:membrane lipoprotein lipid attachment site-containing protein [Amedibacillus sp. YH-ame10]